MATLAAMRTRFAGQTDVGLVREHNEDNLLVLPEFRVVAVADGMGGHRSGDVASQMAVATLSDFFSVTVGKDGTWPFPVDPTLTDEENYIQTGLRLANRRIFDRSLRTMENFGMGTTIVTAMFEEGASKVTVGHVGDSRCYRLRGAEILQLTRDHSLISDAAYMAPWMTAEELRQIPSNVITRALGIREDVVVDIVTDDTQAGDIYLLCSDGLSGMVTDDEMLTIVRAHKILGDACAALIQKANGAGGNDNITVVLARVEPEDETHPDDERTRPFLDASTEEALREAAQKLREQQGKG
jgi:serine/threonine protein phosphatase PrpC